VSEGDASLVHFEGVLVPKAEARIGALSPAFIRGPIAYETLRGYLSEDSGNVLLFRLRDHIARLIASMRVLRFQQLFTPEELSAWIREVVHANKLVTDLHFRIFAYPLDQDGPGRTSMRSGIVIDAEPRPARPARAVHCQVSSWLRRGGDNHSARVKALGIRMFVRTALAQAELDGYDDLIVQDDEGKIAEATSSNIFIVRRHSLATPATTEQILEGITRDTVITLAHDLGLVCEERIVDRTELYDCEEAFLCSTGLEVLPIASVDRIPVGKRSAEGEATRAIRRAYLAAVRGAATKHRDWLTPVY
jgi:branched-chain amino acid aminotransferase